MRRRAVGGAILALLSLLALSAPALAVPSKPAITSGVAEVTVAYGVGADFPVVGDWNGDGTDTIGVVRGPQGLLRNTITGGSAELSFAYGSGAASELPLVWR